MNSNNNKSDAYGYIREKINQLLEVMGTFPLKPEELDDKTLIDLDPIGIIAESFKQILKHQQETNQELEFARNEIRTIFDSINASIIAIDGNGQVKDFNENAKSNFFANLSDNDIYNSPVEKVCACGEGFLHQLHGKEDDQHHMIVNDRNYVVNVSSIGKPDNEQYLEIIHLYDITEQKQIESELNQHRNNLEQLVNERTNDFRKARDEAEKANSAKSEFLSGMSHELRTPLNAILGFAQLFEMDESLDPEQRTNVKEILKAGQHLLTLVNEVLDLSKIESGYIDLSIERIELLKVIRECLKLTDSFANKNNVSIIFNDTHDVVIKADKTRLKQALLNLITNAIKYNCENGSVNIELASEENKLVKIKVTDTGKGLTDDEIENLFTPFNRLDAEAMGIEGTGIGLALTRRIIEHMGGRVCVESTPGVGSTFWIELPIESI